MAYSLVQSRGASANSGTALTVSGLTATTSGNLLVALVSIANNPGDRTFTPPANWVEAGTEVQDDVFISVDTAVYYYANNPGGITSVTFTASGSTSAWHVTILEFSGVATTSPLDATTGRQQGGGTPSSGPITTTQSGDLLIGWSEIDEVSGAGDTTITQPAGYSALARLDDTGGWLSTFAGWATGGSAGSVNYAPTKSRTDSEGVFTLVAFKPGGATAHNLAVEAREVFDVRITKLAQEARSRFSVRTNLTDEARDQFQVRTKLAVEGRSKFVLAARLAAGARSKFTLAAKLALEARDKFSVRIRSLAVEARDTFRVLSTLKQLGAQARDRFLLRAQLAAGSRNTFQIRIKQLAVGSRDRFFLRIHALASEARDRFSVRIKQLASESRNRFVLRAGLAVGARDKFVIRVSSLAAEARNTFRIFVPGAKQLGLELRDKFILRAGLGTQSRERFSIKTGLATQARDKFSLRFSQAFQSRSRFAIRFGMAVEGRSHFVLVLGLRAIGRSSFVIRKALAGVGRAVFKIYQLIAPPQPSTLHAVFSRQQELTAQFSRTNSLHATFTTRQ